MTSQPAPSDDGITRVFDYPLSQRVQALRVDYAPGESTDWRHVHPAGAFVYVLEGSVRMGLEGEDVQTLEPGDSWHETPGTVHSVSENASETDPASLLVVFVVPEGQAPAVPAN
jgi:quercetin dioxygenase-like cupin family protein